MGLVLVMSAFASNVMLSSLVLVEVESEVATEVTWVLLVYLANADRPARSATSSSVLDAQRIRRDARPCANMQSCGVRNGRSGGGFQGSRSWPKRRIGQLYNRAPERGESAMCWPKLLSVGPPRPRLSLGELLHSPSVCGFYQIAGPNIPWNNDRSIDVCTYAQRSHGDAKAIRRRHEITGA